MFSSDWCSIAEPPADLHNDKSVCPTPFASCLAAVRYLGSQGAMASCSTRPQSSLVIGWREGGSTRLRVTSCLTGSGVWDMDHHPGLNLIGGQPCWKATPQSDQSRNIYIYTVYVYVCI